MENTNFHNNMKKIKELAKQRKQVCPEDIDNLIQQRASIQSIYPPDDVRKNVTFLENIRKQQEIERFLYPYFDESYKPLLDIFDNDSYRKYNLWEQIKPVVELNSGLIGWYEPHRPIWENLSNKLDLNNSSYRLAIDLINQSGQPNILCRDYHYPIKEDLKHTFPIEMLKDFIGIQVLLNISNKDADDFFDFLSDKPMLGTKHKIGQKLFKYIPTIEKRTINNIKLFRGRPWEQNQNIPYVNNQMFVAPYGKPSQGRFNPHGLQTLYFSDKKKAVEAEFGIDDKSCKKITIIKVILKRALCIIDISKLVAPIFELCNKPAQYDSPYKTEYLVPNFFAQCCKYHKIDGIAYPSTHIPNVKNYAFFNVFQDSFNVIARF
ncbi:MAG TPA: RES family NAD+ phosphorylase [bacterium]|nr:RES family NAD+ phosphorylase [bacterium]